MKDVCMTDTEYKAKMKQYDNVLNVYIVFVVIICIVAFMGDLFLKR